MTTEVVGGIRIVDMPDLGAITDSSSIVGEHAGSGRFGAMAIRKYAGSGVVNVLDYGATGNGTTDDAAAIQAAATAAQGGVLYFPPDRTYLVGAPSLIPTDTTVIAHGAIIVPAPTIARLPTSTNPSLGNSIGPVMFANVNWQSTILVDKNIRFFGGQIGPLAGPPLACHGIFFRMVTNTHVADVSLQYLNDGVAHLACLNSIVDHCYANGCSNCSYDHWDGPQNATVRDCEVHGASGAYGVLFNIDSTVTGYSSGTGRNFFIENVRIYGTSTAIFVAPLVSGLTLTNARVRDCYINTASAGIVFSEVAGGSIMDNTLDHCNAPVVVGIQGSAPYPSSNIHVVRNILQNCTASGAYFLQVAGSHMTVADNRAINSTCYAAIDVDDPTTIVLPNDLAGWTNFYLLNQHPYGGGTVPALQLDADPVNHWWTSVSVFNAQAGLRIGTAANVATMSTYEEGAWTPVLAFGGGSAGITYSVQAGTYIRIGKAVYITFSITLSAKGTSTGAATISGIPYPWGGAANAPNILCSYYANMLSVTTPPVGVVTTAINLISDVNANLAAALTDTNFAANTFIRFNGWYRVV